MQLDHPDVVALKSAAFTLETLSHLQGHKFDQRTRIGLLNVADQLRKIVAKHDPEYNKEDAG